MQAIAMFEDQPPWTQLDGLETIERYPWFPRVLAPARDGQHVVMCELNGSRDHKRIPSSAHDGRKAPGAGQRRAAVRTSHVR